VVGGKPVIGVAEDGNEVPGDVGRSQQMRHVDLLREEAEPTAHEVDRARKAPRLPVKVRSPPGNGFSFYEVDDDGVYDRVAPDLESTCGDEGDEGVLLLSRQPGGGRAGYCQDINLAALHLCGYNCYDIFIVGILLPYAHDYISRHCIQTDPIQSPHVQPGCLEMSRPIKKNPQPPPSRGHLGHSGPDAISRAAISLSRGSLVNSVLTSLLRFTGKTFDDRTGPLQQSPLGMFFYNQRALFFFFSGIFLIILIPFAFIGKPDEVGDNLKILTLLLGTWAFSILVTLALHRRFTNRLASWRMAEPPSSFPGLFYPYFILDSLAVVALITLSRHLDLHFFALLLFANLVVFSACIATWKGKGLGPFSLPLLLWLACMVLFVRFDLHAKHPPSVFHLLVDLGPLFGTTFVIIMAVLIISWLRHDEHLVTHRQLDFLGKAEDLLATFAEGRARDEQTQASMEREFQARVTALLKDLCSPTSLFWYRSGRFWFIEEHQERGSTLIAGPSHNMNDQLPPLAERPLPQSFGPLPRFHRLPVSDAVFAEVPACFLPSVGSPGFVALIPILKDRRECAVLTLYGVGPAAGGRFTELVFLKTLGRIIADEMEQWDSRRQICAQDEIDELFNRDSLAEIFMKAAGTIRRHLYASCCAILFRGDPTATSLILDAAVGFTSSTGARGLEFAASSNPIGVCATEGRISKGDNSETHQADPPDFSLRALEQLHRQPFCSWMLVPIGKKDKNFGVVFVANRRLKCSWFTADDTLLAERLTLRLKALVEKFLQIASIEAAHKRAEEKAAEAEAARKTAESIASQRQDDLMVMTHQVQAPLAAVRFGLQALLMEKQARFMHEKLGHIEAIIEDSLALCYGTVTTFAQAAGRRASFGAIEIDAPEELSRLCRRLQRTNYRQDLKLKFESDSSFPKLVIDKNVFTSVLYSLVQNAMKYAEKHSHITLECSFERASREAALKVKSLGEPILPQESDRIFERYQRGTVVARTGRYHAGVGLGLWVARELMRAIGGDLTLELSADHPRLSVFVVHFPPRTPPVPAARAV
jgi:signal transduction histidine kinase